MLSIITPFYHGNRFLAKLEQVLEENIASLCETKPDLKAEWILVNDSPDTQVEIPHESKAFSIRVINLTENGGIHHARVQGLAACKGDLIYFLDQDDTIEKNFLRKLLTALDEQHADFAVGNCLMEEKNGERTPRYQRQADIMAVGTLNIYLRVMNPIVSPGQCLIRRTSIPTEWSTYTMSKNGSDDLLLWILMLAKGQKSVVVPSAYYLHRYTGENVSGSLTQISDSSMEVVKTLEKCGALNRSQLTDLRHSVEWGARSSQENRKYYLRQPRIFLTRLFWKIEYRCSRTLSLQNPDFLN